MDNQQKTTKSMGKEIGASGTFINSGIITNEDYNTKLIGSQAVRNYDIMRRSDATAKAALLVCKLPILSASWTIQPAKDANGKVTPEDQKIADEMNQEIFHGNFSFHDFLRQGLSMFDFGYSVFEKTFMLVERDGKVRIGIKSLGFRKQRSVYSWETEDGKPGITQQLIDTTVSIPAAKLIIFSHDKEGDNYEGTSILRAAYKHWDIKDKLDRVNAIAIEKMAIGVPVLKKPEGADPKELGRAREALRNFRGNEQGYQEIPEGWTLEMLDMKANSNKEVIPTIQYHDRQIMKAVLAQFIELGGVSGASGSRSVSEDHSSFFFKSLEAAANNIKTTIEEQLIKQLCDLNYTNLPNGYPTIAFNNISDQDPSTLAESISKFTSAGVLTPDKEIESQIRELLHMPAMSEEVVEAWDKKELGQSSTDPKKTKVDDTLDTEDDKPDPKQNKEQLKAHAIAQAKTARNGLIDILTRE